MDLLLCCTCQLFGVFKMQCVKIWWCRSEGPWLQRPACILVQVLRVTGEFPALALTNLACVCVCSVAQSCLTLETPWTTALQAPLSMGFPRQEYWSGLPFPSTGDLPSPGIKLKSVASPALASGFFAPAPPQCPLLSIESDSEMCCTVRSRSVDRGAWRTGVHGIAQSWAWLSSHPHAHT